MVLAVLLLLSGCSSFQNGFLGFAPFGDKQQYVRARDLYNEQKYQEAVTELTQYIYKAGNVNRREARAYRLLGMSYEQLDRLDKALETYLEALEFHPKNIPLLTAAASLYQRTGLIDKSQLLYERVLAQDPQNLTALVGQAENYQTFGFFSQARNYYDEFFRLNPSASANYRAQYATTFLNQSNFEQAFIHITMALAEDAQQPDYWLISAKASFGLGRYDDALAAINTALTLAPHRTDLQLYKIIGLYQTQYYTDAVRLANQLLHQHPDNQLGWLLLALNEWKLNQRTQARTHLRKAATLEDTSFTGKVAAQLLEEWK
ncbi:MAG: tetratricopeptide repeat protein [Elusimicrobiaceae bacterium]|nr:tetratricopeptide repeat protein [Elusimicrobiaceae bacterium]